MTLYFNSCNKNMQHLKAKLTWSAKVRLKIYTFNQQEKQIDLYLQKNYNITLAGVCSALISTYRINIDKTTKLGIITFPPKYNMLADLITYGNTEIRGCKILKKIFKLII